MKPGRSLAILTCLPLTLAAGPLFGAGPQPAAEPRVRAEDCDKNQTNLNLCSFQEYQALDAQLNDLYRRQQARLKGTPDAKRLADAERAWLAYVEADCLYQNGPSAESGTIWPLLQNRCRSAHFAERIKLLKSFVECTQDGCKGQ